MSGQCALVTGATGIVGSWLCEELLARGNRVIALVLDDDPQSRFYSEGIYRRCSVVRGNLASFDACMRAVNRDEISAVFHLGAQTIVGSAHRDPLECFDSNIRGTYNLLEAVRRLLDREIPVVIASSDKAYGSADKLPYTEETPLQGRHPYDVSKSCADLLAQAYANSYGTNVTIARCGNIYGGGDLNWSRLVPSTIRSLLADESPRLRSDGSMTRDYIYVRDVVAAYLALAEAAVQMDIRGQAFNFSPESRLSVIEMVKEICTIMGKDLAPTVLNSATMEIQHQTLDASKARATLNWRCRYDLRTGLTETVSWYRSMLDRHAGLATQC